MAQRAIREYVLIPPPDLHNPGEKLCWTLWRNSTSTKIEFPDIKGPCRNEKILMAVRDFLANHCEQIIGIGHSGGGYEIFTETPV